MGDVVDSILMHINDLSIPIPQYTYTCIHQRGLKKIDDYNFCISHAKMYLVSFFSEVFLGSQRGKYFLESLLYALSNEL